MAKLNNTTTIGGESLLDYFYPVGTLYYTEDDSFDPATKWGGTWEKIKGRFILGTDDSSRKTSKLTGGEETHTLSISEIPSHNHGTMYQVSGGGDKGSNYSGLPFVYAGYLSADSAYWTTRSVGGGAAHNNMPPYYTANIWHRTA